MSNPAKQIRERACDWLIIGPVVGFTEAQTTRVLAQPYEKHRGMLELRLAKAVENVRFDEAAGGYAPVEVVGDLHRFPVSEEGGFHTVIFEPEGLEPDTRYFYEVVPEDAPREVAGCFASRQPYSLRTLPSSPGAFRFSFHSCNGLHKPPRGGTPTNMWRRLLREVTRHRDLHFALLGGDQVYCDVIREEWLREWEPTFDPACFDPSDGDARRCVEFLSQLPERYERIYRTFWRRPELRTFMGHVPCLMTWDDHEMYDGWGSYGDEELPAQQAFFSAAAACFDAFQFSLAPQRMLSSAAAGLRNNHRAYSFMVGDAAFLVLDLRSKRNIKSREASAVLGDEQWAWFDAEIEELARRRPKQIVVVLSIPLVHMGAEVEHIMPSAAEMHDDVLDHWSSRPNRNDALRLVGNLFRLRRQTGANVLLLSGDVHVGTIGHIASRDPRTLLDGEVESRLHQGVSSAIAYEAPIGISANVVRYLVQREHPMRGGYLGRIEDVVAERNFAVISAHPDKVFRLHLYRESSEVPDQFYLPVK